MCIFLKGWLEGWTTMTKSYIVRELCLRFSSLVKFENSTLRYSKNVTILKVYSTPYFLLSRPSGYISLPPRHSSSHPFLYSCVRMILGTKGTTPMHELNSLLHKSLILFIFKSISFKQDPQSQRIQTLPGLMIVLSPFIKCKNTRDLFFKQCMYSFNNV